MPAFPETEKLAYISLRLTPEMVGRLDAVVERRRDAAPFAVVNRSDVLREILGDYLGRCAA